MMATEAVETAILNRFGLSPKEGWRDALCRAAKDIGRKSKLPTEQLLQRALTDEALLEQLVGRLTVSESFFFRGYEQLAFVASFVKTTLSDTLDGETVRVWSAGCSSGAEPYSLAILFKETLPPTELKRVTLFGNDVNGDVIALAREAVFTDWHFRGLDDARRNTYFKKLDDGHYALSSDITRMVAFEHRSIQQQLTRLTPSSVDVILFRNVGIYLTSDCLETIYEHFSLVLKSGGLLCTAPSDPGVSHPDLERIDTDHGVVYRKRDAAFVAAFAPSVVQNQRPDAGVLPVLGEVTFTDAPLSPDASIGASIRPPSNAPTVPEREPDRNGDWLMNGQAALDARDPALAEAIFRRALFSDPVDPSARFWYALALFETGAVNRSRAQLNALVASLQEVAPSEILGGGESTVGEIVQYARSLLDKMNGCQGE